MADPYARPGSVDPTPRAIFAFRVYAIVMAVVQVAAAIGLGVLVGDVRTSVVLGVLGSFFGAAAFVPRTPWGWSVALVAIALGIPSVTIVVALPLVLAWRSPIVKAAFRRL